MKKRILCALMALCMLIGCVPAIEAARAESFTAYVVAGSLRVYETPDTSSRYMTVLFCDSFLCDAVEGEWARLRNGSYYGYCALSGISSENPNKYQDTMYAITDGVPVYDRASTDARVMMYINTNDSYTATAYSSDGIWTRMVNGPYVGYVESRYLSRTPIGEETYVYVTENTLNVYESPSESSAVLNVASYGESFLCDAVQEGWCRVETGGGYGFCREEGMDVADPNTLHDTVYIAGDNVPVRRRADAGSDVMMYASKNAGYTARAITPDGAWYRLQNGAYYGYVEARFIAYTPIGGDSYPIFITDNTLNAYALPDAGSSVLGVMSYGESFLCTAVSGEWAQITADGRLGYCRVSGISPTDPNTLSVGVYINTNDVPVYRKADTSSAVMMRLQKNACYIARAVTRDGAWYRLQNGAYYGYVQSGYISDSPTEDGQRVYISANTLKAYSGPSDYATVLGVMSFGESMMCLDTSGEWAKIQNGAGSIGFCRLDGLTVEDPNIYAHTVYVCQSGAVLYSKPDYGYPTSVAARVNESYIAVAVTQDNAWVRLIYGSGHAYIRSEYITDVPQSKSAETVYIRDNTMPVYASASTESAVLGVMSFGESLTMQAVQDGWAQVANGAGQIGYCRYGSLTKVNPNTENVQVYVLHDARAIRRKPLPDAEVMYLENRGACFTAVSITADQAWVRVAVNGAYGYIAAEDLSLDKPSEQESDLIEVEPFTVYVTDNLLGCYATSDVNSALLGVMSYGEAYTCTAYGDGWAKLRNSAGAVGYAQISGLNIHNPNVAGITVYPQVSGVPVYSKPSTGAPMLGSLRVNSGVTAIAITQDNEWLRLQNGSAVGYAESKYFSTSPVNNGASGKASAIVELAQQQMGKSYVYGAEGPSTFDCSGLVGYVYYYAAGVVLPRTAYAQGYDDDYAKINEMTSLQIGDLVFFDTSSDSDLCDHVGIYIGGGQFIHASSAGGRVMTSSLLNNSYYARTFSWGRRVL